MATSGIEKLAIKASSKSNLLFRMGAVIHRGTMILGVGYNYRIPMSTNRRFQDKYSIHAEMMALSRALHTHSRYIVRGSEIVIYRIIQSIQSNRYKKIKPCATCAKILDEYGVVRKNKILLLHPTEEPRIAEGRK